MKLNRPLVHAVVAVSIVTLAGCEEKKPAPAPTGTGAPSGHAAHGGAVIDLGSSAIGGFDVQASRDAGLIVAGKDAPIDVTVTPGAGSTAKAAAVRFWIGTEDAKGSVKARADIENPAEPNRWHTHAEIPNPIPAGSRLWVEIEAEGGAINAGSFDLKV
ncbi:MAG: hypothetical protein ACKVU4_06175 [Phycisphaerales bacterium]